MDINYKKVWLIVKGLILVFRMKTELDEMAMNEDQKFVQDTQSGKWKIFGKFINPQFLMHKVKDID